MCKTDNTAAAAADRGGVGVGGGLGEGVGEVEGEVRKRESINLTGPAQQEALRCESWELWVCLT